MSWWDLGGSSIDEVCGDRPADRVGHALVQMLADRGGKPSRQQLFAEIAAVIGASGLPSKRLVAIRVTCDGGTTRAEPVPEVPPWGAALLRQLRETWRDHWRRAPTMREVSAAFSFVLGPALAEYTSDGTELDGIRIEWDDARGRLAVADTLAVLRGCIERTVPAGVEVVDLVATLEDGAKLTAPGATFVDDAVKNLTRVLKEHDAKASLPLVLEFAVRGILDDLGRYAVARDGVPILGLALSVRAKHARVRHPTFGMGLVIEDHAGKAKVAFDHHGEKLLVTKSLSVEAPPATPFTVGWELPSADRDALR